MSGYRFLLKRAVWMIGGIYAVMSATFAFVTFAPDPNRALAAWAAVRSGGNGTAALDAYAAARNQNMALLDRYVLWLERLTTLDFGTSLSHGQTPVMSLVGDALLTTATYALPGLVLTAVVGVSLGTISGLTSNRWVDGIVRGISYFGLGVPHFYIAGVLFAYVGAFQFGASRTLRLLGATLVLVVTMVAAQTRYTRSEVSEYVDTDFVKLVRAKGAGPVRTAWHVLRNAALPLVTLFISEFLGVLALTSIVVEEAFALDGIGALAFGAMLDRDMPLIIGVVIAVSVVGIVGTFLQDVLYTVLDPRVGFEE